MPIGFDLAQPHEVAAANYHYYKASTKALYLDRVLQFHDLIYLAEGGWAFTEDDTEYPLEKGDVLLLTAGVHHYTRLPCLPETRTMCIHVVPAPGDRADSASAVTLPTLLHAKGFPSVKRYFEEIVASQWSETSHRRERMSSLFNLLILELVDAQSRPRPDKSSVAEEIVRIVNANPHRHFKVSEIADMLYVSGKTVENAVNQATHMSFAKYQMNRKLEMAALQLKVEPDVRLSEIASAFGFCDEFHMSKAFKRKYGVSPLHYRREGR